MSSHLAQSDEAGTFVSRKEWLALRAYFRGKDGKKDSSGARRKRKAKGGRPRLPANVRRRGVMFKFSEDELNKLKAFATAAKMNLSKWLRSKVLKPTDHPTPTLHQ